MSEPSTIHNDLDGDLVFTVTHPFHPLAGQQFPLLARRVAWGEPRAFFHDLHTRHVRSLPVAWTDLAPADPFVTIAAGRAFMRFTDLAVLAQLLRDLPDGVAPSTHEPGRSPDAS